MSSVSSVSSVTSVADPAPRDANPRRLVLWRHGRTAWNVIGRAQGTTDVPMDDVGRQQARDAAARLASLRPRFIWSSPLSRALDTASELAALTGLDVHRDARLQEIDTGARQGLTLDEVRERFPDTWRAFQAGEELPRAPGGETEPEVAERVSAAMRDATEALGPADISVLVSHGVSIRVGLCRFPGAPARSLAPPRRCLELRLGGGRGVAPRLASGRLQRRFVARAGALRRHDERTPLTRPQRPPADFRLPERTGYTRSAVPENGCSPSSGRRLGAVAQLVAHLHGMEGVRGSNPLSSTGHPLG